MNKNMDDGYLKKTIVLFSAVQSPEEILNSIQNLFSSLTYELITIYDDKMFVFSRFY